MHTMNYTQLRQNLAMVMDQVNDDHTPMLITRQSAKPAVLMSYEDYQGIEETLYLLSSPENAKRLRASIIELNAGKGVKRDLLE
jgi:antitoxin YefM